MVYLFSEASYDALLKGCQKLFFACFFEEAVDPAENRFLSLLRRSFSKLRHTAKAADAVSRKRSTAMQLANLVIVSVRISVRVGAEYVFSNRSSHCLLLVWVGMA